MKVLVTGTNGQLGQALLKSVPKNIELIATSRSQLDLSNHEACQAAVNTHRPDWVLNAGAYTAVDQAQSEPELAYAVNAGAPAAFAQALQEQGAGCSRSALTLFSTAVNQRPIDRISLLTPLGFTALQKQPESRRFTMSSVIIQGL